MKIKQILVILGIVFLTSLNAANLFDYIKAGLVCPLVKIVNFKIIAKGQSKIDNEIGLPKKINEDMILEKVGFEIKNKNILYYVKCSKEVDKKIYLNIYIKKLNNYLIKNPSIKCIFNSGIHYKYIFYKINKNKKLQILNIVSFPIKNISKYNIKY